MEEKHKRKGGASEGEKGEKVDEENDDKEDQEEEDDGDLTSSVAWSWRVDPRRLHSIRQREKGSTRDEREKTAA